MQNTCWEANCTLYGKFSVYLLTLSVWPLRIDNKYGVTKTTFPQNTLHCYRQFWVDSFHHPLWKYLDGVIWKWIPQASLLLDIEPSNVCMWSFNPIAVLFENETFQTLKCCINRILFFPSILTDKNDFTDHWQVWSSLVKSWRSVNPLKSSDNQNDHLP